MVLIPYGFKHIIGRDAMHGVSTICTHGVSTICTLAFNVHSWRFYNRIGIFIDYTIFNSRTAEISNKNNKMSYFNTPDPCRGDLNFRQIQKVPS